MTKSAQTLFWEGEFGTEYAKRCDFDPAMRCNFWKKILELANDAKSVCELGANIGINLKAMNMLKSGLELYGVEANKTACDKMAQADYIKAIHTPIQEFTPDRKFNLVFTCGVLIHINPNDLPEIYKKMYEWSDEYILINEYFNPKPVAIEYRGNTDRLFKRDFAAEFMEANKGKVKLVDYGFLWNKAEPAWDNTTWFLMKRC